MRGAFNLRPALPRYANVWDVSVVIKYLKSLSPTDQLTFKQLTMKLVMLTALLSGQRAQSLQLLHINNMSRTSESATFVLDKPVKQTRPGYHIKPIYFRRYHSDIDLCVLNTLSVYLEKSEPLRRMETQLLISYQKPFKAVTTATISRWLKSVLSCSGINTDQFRGHSVRSASTSAAYSAGTSIQTIMNAAGWSSECTFTKFYNKDKNIDTFSEGVLKAAMPV